YRRAMAELGCVRYCLEIVRDAKASDDDKATFLRKARALGYRDPAQSQPDRLSATPPSIATPMTAAAAAPVADPVKQSEEVLAKATAAIEKAEKKAASTKTKPTAKEASKLAVD